ncbi:hypothetical protein [Pseudophaeobacter sp.]
MTKNDARRKSCWRYPAREARTAAQMRGRGPATALQIIAKGSA